MIVIRGNNYGNHDDDVDVKFVKILDATKVLGQECH